MTRTLSTIAFLGLAAWALALASAGPADAQGFAPRGYYYDGPGVYVGPYGYGYGYGPYIAPRRQFRPQARYGPADPYHIVGPNEPLPPYGMLPDLPAFGPGPERDPFFGREPFIPRRPNGPTPPPWVFGPFDNPRLGPSAFSPQPLLPQGRPLGQPMIDPNFARPLFPGRI